MLLVAVVVLLDVVLVVDEVVVVTGSAPFPLPPVTPPVESVAWTDFITIVLADDRVLLIVWVVWVEAVPPSP